MGKTKIKIITTLYTNDGKVTNCKMGAVANINDLLSEIKDSNLYMMLRRNPKWKKLVNHYNNMRGINISCNIITINVEGRSVCHDDDGFDKHFGENLARKRALEKLYRIWFYILRDIQLILEETASQIFEVSNKCLTVWLNTSADIDDDEQADGENNYWT